MAWQDIVNDILSISVIILSENVQTLCLLLCEYEMLITMAIHKVLRKLHKIS